MRPLALAIPRQNATNNATTIANTLKTLRASQPLRKALAICKRFFYTACTNQPHKGQTMQNQPTDWRDVACAVVIGLALAVGALAYFDVLFF